MIRCGCGRSSHAPVKLLLGELGNITFKSYLSRLRCQQCKGLPGPVCLCAGHHCTFCGGSAPDWVLEVVFVLWRRCELRHDIRLWQDRCGLAGKLALVMGRYPLGIVGLTAGLAPQMDVTLVIRRADGDTQEVPLTLRIDTPIEVDYYLNGGILPYVLRQLLEEDAVRQAGALLDTLQPRPAAV